jgi:hypothetical protein
MFVVKPDTGLILSGFTGTYVRVGPGSDPRYRLKLNVACQLHMKTCNKIS